MESVGAESRRPSVAGQIARQRQVGRCDASDSAARSCHRSRRSGMPRRQQPEAGGFPGTQSGRRRSDQDPRPSYGAVRARAARASCTVRARHREAARLLLLRPTGRAARATRRRGVHRDRCNPYVPRAVRALFRRLDAQGQPRRRAGCGSPRQPVHRAQHRRHAGNRRGDGVPQRNRDRAGQRDPRIVAARRRAVRLGRLRDRGADAALH